ncbi:hypothetical protein EPYR_02346 [Erwinia pyrifoliae DSM 12163]|nr:hypothetical protein EPYR_02346 [Erwinia pyrifoliae DSM 12163]
MTGPTGYPAGFHHAVSDSTAAVTLLGYRFNPDKQPPLSLTGSPIPSDSHQQRIARPVPVSV